MTNKICNDRGGSDKWLHRIVILAIGALLSGLLSMAKFLAPIWCAVIVFTVCMAISIWRELKGKKQKGNHFCWWDLLADFEASVIISILAYAANYCTWHV